MDLQKRRWCEEAEIGGMSRKAKECQKPTEAGRGKE
jgi:hypothetical protein